MAAHRFFLTGPFQGGVLPLTAEDLHHAVKVARIAPGEVVAAVEPDGRALLVEVTSASPGALEGAVTQELPRDDLPDVSVFFGLPKGSKAELIVEKCTEIGVGRLVPFAAERAVVRLDEDRASRKAQRLDRVARAAAAQAQRSSVPAVESPASFAEVVAAVSSYDRFLVAWEDSDAAPGIAGALEGCDPSARVAVLVGPEGGLTPAEVTQLQQTGARVVSLGATILRAETAAVVAAALASAALGGMGEARGR